LPVVCPKCGNEHLTEVPIAVVADALIKNESVYLRAACHDAAWNASPTEIEQSRQYLGAMDRRSAGLTAFFDKHARYASKRAGCRRPPYRPWQRSGNRSTI
jgi:hypothetical protein